MQRRWAGRRLKGPRWWITKLTRGVRLGGKAMSILKAVEKQVCSRGLPCDTGRAGSYRLGVCYSYAIVAAVARSCARTPASSLLSV